MASDLISMNQAGSEYQTADISCLCFKLEITLAQNDLLPPFPCITSHLHAFPRASQSSLNCFPTLIDLMGAQPSTLYFQVQNKLKEVLGTTPETTRHVHLCVPRELRIARVFVRINVFSAW